MIAQDAILEILAKHDKRYGFDFEAAARELQALINQDKDKHIASLQAKIDALMLEYCPDEMTVEQKAEWAAHQKPAAFQMPTPRQIRNDALEEAAKIFDDCPNSEMFRDHIAEKIRALLSRPAPDKVLSPYYHGATMQPKEPT